MGKSFACCGHEVLGDYGTYYWKEYNRECEPCLAYGSLCPKCILVYRAVEAETEEGAMELLEKVEPIDLIDIVAGQYNAQVEIIDVGGIPFRTVTVGGDDETHTNK